MDRCRRDGGYYPPHQPYIHRQAPPPDYPPHQFYSYHQAPPPGYPPRQYYSYPEALPPVVNSYYNNYTMPPNYSNTMHPSYANAMPPAPPGYPYYPTQNYWQPLEAHPGTPHGFDAYGNQATWPIGAPGTPYEFDAYGIQATCSEQPIEREQGWMNKNDHSSHLPRDFDVIEVERKVLSPPLKSLPAKPQPLAADVYRAGPISLEKADAIRTTLPKTTAAPLEIKVNDNQKAAAPDTLTRVSESSNFSSSNRSKCRLLPGVNMSDLILSLGGTEDDTEESSVCSVEFEESGCDEDYYDENEESEDEEDDGQGHNSSLEDDYFDGDGKSTEDEA